MSGSAIFIEEIGFAIRQPTLKDISIIGEEKFYKSISYFMINKDKLSLEGDIRDFDILTYFCLTNEDIKSFISELLILTIEDIDDIIFDQSLISVVIAGHETIIDESKFLIIKETFKQIFCLNQSSESSLNPADDIARKIAEKLEKRKAKLAAQNKEKKEENILSNFISVLAIGANSISISECLNLTIYQMYNLIKRFNMHAEYHIQMQALMQGAENIELVEWTKQI